MDILYPWYWHWEKLEILPCRLQTELINGPELLPWTFSVRFLGTARAVGEGNSENGTAIHQFSTATNLPQTWAARWKHGTSDEAKVWHSAGDYPQHGFCYARISGVTSCFLLRYYTRKPYKYKSRTTALTAGVPVFCTLLGPIYLMVFFRAVLMP